MIYKLVTRVIHYFCFPRETDQRWGHLGFLERGESEKRGGGVDLEKREGGITPLTNNIHRPPLKF